MIKKLLLLLIGLVNSYDLVENILKVDPDNMWMQIPMLI